ncbi:MAG: type II secretion system GspH family protein [Holophagaceae bacterium]|nr:type II secretion system GspH family protein [Holophagaceae bacterium]
MLRRNRARGAKRAKGFTLVELLLVVAIIGIISGVAVPSFIGQRKRARIIGDARANAKIIQMALETRRAEIGIYGPADTYNYTLDNGTYTRPTVDIVPSFSPQGNSKMNYVITINQGGLTYRVRVLEQGKTVAAVSANQTGEVREGEFPD